MTLSLRPRSISSRSWLSRTGALLQGRPPGCRAAEAPRGQRFETARELPSRVPALEVVEGGRLARLNPSAAVREPIEERLPGRSRLAAVPGRCARTRATADPCLAPRLSAEASGCGAGARRSLGSPARSGPDARLDAPAGEKE